MHRFVGMFERLWPAAAVVLLFSALNVLIVVSFTPAIEAVVAVPWFAQWEGPHTLLALSSGAMGWLTTGIVSQRSGSVGIQLALICMFLGAIGATAAFWVTVERVTLSPAARGIVLLSWGIPLVVAVMLRTAWTKCE